MDSSAGGPAATYAVACYTCKAFFDAMAAPWCHCIVARRSFACPSCHRCFCKAPASYRQAFWEKAPQALWDRAGAERGALGEVGASADDVGEDALPRPLVLVVDDEKDIQRFASIAIRSLGFGAAVASDGEAGLALVRRLRPELVLTDAMMPRLDGREMCRQIKADAALAGTRVVIMTSLYRDPRYKYEAFRDFHADGWLTKPFELSELQTMLREQLGRE